MNSPFGMSRSRLSKRHDHKVSAFVPNGRFPKPQGEGDYFEVATARKPSTKLRRPKCSIKKMFTLFEGKNEAHVVSSKFSLLILIYRGKSNFRPTRC